VAKKTVVLSLLGTLLDRGATSRRWESWRPTVALCQHDDLLVDRLELLYPKRSTELAELVRTDIRQVSPETEVRLTVDPVRDPWDFEDVYANLHDFARTYPFDITSRRYVPCGAWIWNLPSGSPSEFPQRGWRQPCRLSSEIR